MVAQALIGLALGACVGAQFRVLTLFPVAVVVFAAGLCGGVGAGHSVAYSIAMGAYIVSVTQFGFLLFCFVHTYSPAALSQIEASRVRFAKGIRRQIDAATVRRLVRAHPPTLTSPQPFHQKEGFLP